MVLKRFDASLEWFMERIVMRAEEMERIKSDDKMNEAEKSQLLMSKRM